MRGREITMVRQRRVALVAAASATAVLAAFAGAAAADDAGTTAAATPPDATTTTSTSEATAASATGGSSGSTSLVLRSENVWPTRVFFHGVRHAAYHFTIGGGSRQDLQVQAVNRNVHRVERRWNRQDVAPGTEQRVRWDGTLRDGTPAPKGDYLFRIRDSNGDPADRTRSKRSGRRAFGLFPYKFPVRGRHAYGDGVGAPRAGHRHQGQDVLAACGTKLVAARGGRVQYNAYQAGGAGYYLVIDGRKTGHDFVYMHLRRRSRLGKGSRVKTGQTIGRVGHTGDASGCHLHMEEWSSPGWYEGGHFMRAITQHLKRWDRWS